MDLKYLIITLTFLCIQISHCKWIPSLMQRDAASLFGKRTNLEASDESGLSKRETYKDFLAKRSAGRVSWKECHMDNELREDCGFYGVTEPECYKRECCWSETKTTGVPWCYYSAPTLSRKCTMHSDERVECGYYGIRKEQCLHTGCCWQPVNINGVPWCYHVKKITPQTGECGNPAISPSVAGRIVGGKPAIANSWPWQVSLQRGGHFCGGSVINTEWIVTAAHCEPGFKWGSGKKIVVVGMHSTITEGPSQKEIEVEEIIPHQNYDQYEYDQDIMLLKLKEKIEFSDEVSPVCLPAQNEAFDAGTKCYTTGWGNLESGGDSPTVLQQVMIPLISTKVCNQEDWYNGKITENMICAGYPEGGRDSCQGDSGGPLVCFHDEKWKLAGIVSWGYGCADEKQPGVYAKTSNFINWIEDQITEYSKKHKTK